MRHIEIGIRLDAKDMKEMDELKQAIAGAYPTSPEKTLEELVLMVISNKFDESLKDLIRLYRSIESREEGKRDIGG